MPHGVTLREIFTPVRMEIRSPVTRRFFPRHLLLRLLLLVLLLLRQSKEKVSDRTRVVCLKPMAMTLSATKYCRAS